MNNISLLTFSSSNWIKSKERFNNDIKFIQDNFKYFYKTFIWSEKNLDDQYHNRFSKYFSDHGFAYWSWKPISIIKVMEQIENGDFLLYLDGDCFLPHENTVCFLNDIDKVRKTIIEDKAKIGLTTYIDVNGFKITNVAIGKREILEKFNLNDNKEFLYDYPHLQSGLILMQKNDWTKSFLNKWYDFYLQNYESCIRGGYTDRTNQNIGFIHNGGDQTILQCILFEERPNIASMNFMYKYNVITNNWG